jgi:uncharacterized surface protein with fasciclin (FAS1) repeats
MPTCDMGSWMHTIVIGSEPLRNRTARLLSMLIGTVLIVAGCATAEEAGEEPTETEGGGAPAISSEPAIVESEPASEPASEPSLGTSETEAGTGDTGDISAETILELAEQSPQLSQLVAAIEAAGLTDALEQAGPITVFAPNNNAFASLGQDDLTALLANPQSLTDRLEFHVVEGSHMTSDLTDGQTLTTLEGSELEVSVQGDTVSVNGAEIVEPDLEAGNGVVHIIDDILEP